MMSMFRSAMKTRKALTHTSHLAVEYERPIMTDAQRCRKLIEQARPDHIDMAFSIMSSLAGNGISVFPPFSYSRKLPESNTSLCASLCCFTFDECRLQEMIVGSEYE